MFFDMTKSLHLVFSAHGGQSFYAENQNCMQKHSCEE